MGDNGVIASLEVRFPILQQEGGIGRIELAPFVDIGRVWNTNSELPILSPRTLASAGLGLRWQIGSTFTARLDWGIPIISVERQGSTLQDSGFVFSMQLQLF